MIEWVADGHVYEWKSQDKESKAKVTDDNVLMYYGARAFATQDLEPFEGVAALHRAGRIVEALESIRLSEKAAQELTESAQELGMYEPEK